MYYIWSFNKYILPTTFCCSVFDKSVTIVFLPVGVAEWVESEDCAFEFGAHGFETLLSQTKYLMIDICCFTHHY